MASPSRDSASRRWFKHDGLLATGIIRGTQYSLQYAEDTLGEPCVYCGEPGMTWEHVTPISLGGAKGILNRVRACLKCNNSRSSKPFIVWMLLRVKVE